ncbi:MAG: hypothetical protein ACI4RL_05140, partial [Ruminococcus sp.]
MNYLQRKKWAIMRAGSFHGYLRTTSGYPLTLTDSIPGYPVSLSVSGNTVQNGTPSPDNPVEVQGCGELTDDGYKIPLVFSGKNLLSSKYITWSSSADFKGLTVEKLSDGALH